MATTTETILYQLRVESAQFKRDMLTIKRSTGGVVRELRQMQRLMVEMPRHTQKTSRAFMGISRSLLGIGASAYAIWKVREGFHHLRRTAVEYEFQMSRVRALTNSTGLTFSQMESEIRALGRSTIYTSKQVAEGAQYLALAGLEAGEITTTLSSTLALAQVGMIDMATAADISTNVLVGFGLQANQLSSVIDIMAATVSSSNTNVQQMGEAMRYVAPIARELGISVAETSAAIGIMGNAGFQGSLATRAIRTSLARLAHPTKEQAILMKKLGIELWTNDQRFKGLIGVVKEMEKATEDMTQKAKLHTAAVVFGSEALAQMQSLVSAGSEEIQQFTDYLEESQGVAKQMQKIMGQNLKASTLEAKSAFEDLGISIGKFANDYLQNAIDKMTEFLKLLGQVKPIEEKAVGTSLAEIERKAWVDREGAMHTFGEYMDYRKEIGIMTKADREALANKKYKEAEDITKLAKLRKFEGELETATGVKAYTMPGMGYTSLYNKLSVGLDKQLGSAQSTYALNALTAGIEKQTALEDDLAKQNAKIYEFLLTNPKINRSDIGLKDVEGMSRQELYDFYKGADPDELNWNRLQGRVSARQDAAKALTDYAPQFKALQETYNRYPTNVEKAVTEAGLKKVDGGEEDPDLKGIYAGGRKILKIEVNIDKLVGLETAQFTGQDAPEEAAGITGEQVAQMVTEAVGEAAQSQIGPKP